MPDTSVILVRATADTAAVAEGVADATTALASSYLAGIAKPYRTEVVHDAQGSAYSSGTSPTLLFALAIVVALIAGLAIQQAVYHLMMTVSRSKHRDVNSNLNGAVKHGAHSRVSVGGG